MEHNHSWQMPLPQSDEIERKVDDPMNSQDDNDDSAFVVTERQLRCVMTQYEMEILTTLFPRAAQTLAGVLRNRSD
jgi:hypothetical protein